MFNAVARSVLRAKSCITFLTAPVRRMEREWGIRWSEISSSSIFRYTLTFLSRDSKGDCIRLSLWGTVNIEIELVRKSYAIRALRVSDLTAKWLMRVLQ